MRHFHAENFTYLSTSYEKTTAVHFYYNFWPFSIILIQKSLIAAISLEEKISQFGVRLVFMSLKLV